MEVAINQVEYSNSPQGPIIHVFGRDVEGNSKHLRVTGFQPYFFIPLEEAIEANHPPNAYPDIETEYVSIYGQPVRKVYVDRPSDVRDIRDKYHHFEGDISYPVRFMLDMNLTRGISVPSELSDYRKVVPIDIDVPSRVCMIDIECTDERGWPEPERDEIICVTCWDSFDDEYMTFLYLRDGISYDKVQKKQEEGGLENGCFDPGKHTICVFRSEKNMMKAFVGYIKSRDPDILTGWNFTLFDLFYITKRFEALGLRVDSLARLPGMERSPARGRVVFDLLEGFKKMHQAKEESYRLDAVAAKEVGMQKIHFTESISDLWKNSPERLIEYNFVDVFLCVAIDKKNEIIKFYREVSSYVGCPMDRSLNSSNVVDTYVLRAAHGQYVLPTKGSKDQQEETFEGAVVFPPVKGVHENVAVLDLKSLYPMIMVTGNFSPETKDPNGDIVAPNGVRFVSKPDGLARKIVFDLLKKRDDCKAERNKYEYNSIEYKRLDMKQAVLKIIMNTYYGVSGHSGFRLHDREIGEAITSTGQAILEHNRKIVVAEGYEVVTGDTDAVDIKIPSSMTREQTIAEARRLEKLMNDSYPAFAKSLLNADVSYFSVKFEKLYERFFSGGRKKRYAGHLIWKEGKDVDDIDVVGFEVRRSDSPAITRSTQKELIKMILEGKTFDEVKQVLGDVVQKYRKGEYSLDEIGIPGGIGKALDQYDNLDAQVRGAIYANKYLGANFGKGSKPKRLYIKQVTWKYPRTDVICFEYGVDLPPEFIVDREVMLEKTIQKPIERILEALDWGWKKVEPSYTTLKQWGA